MANEIAECIEQLLTALNSHDLENVASFYAPDFVGEDIATAKPQRGPQERVRVLGSYIRAFPDLHFSGESLIDGNRAALVWTMSGTQQGTIMRIPPTGRHIEVRGVSMLTFRQGKIIHVLNIWDMAGMLRGLGLLPEL